MGDERLIQQVLDDWRTAPIAEPLRAMLGFLEQLTLRPATVTPQDVAPLRARGLNDAAIEDAIHVAVLFNMYDRMADTLGFDVPGPESFAFGARRLLTHGYK